MKLGLMLSGVSALAQGAIASGQNEPSGQLPSMAALNLPRLETPAQSGPDIPAPAIAEVMPDVVLIDVSPNHWSYAAVASLTNDYECLKGYPDSTFRGGDLVTRYEFVAALDACLNRFIQQVEPASQSELDAIRQDLTDLEAELGTLAE